MNADGKSLNHLSINGISINEVIEDILKNHYKLSFSDPKKIAKNILMLSDYYIQNPKASTPWKEQWCQIAYLAYYLPLNFARAYSIQNEITARAFPSSQTMIDFGSGLGSASLALLQNKTNAHLINIESSIEARKFHQILNEKFKLHQIQSEWLSTFTENIFRNISAKDSTAVFSYSLAELTSLPKWALQCQNIILIEPSTKEISRRLLKIREELLISDFYVWAPCIHQGPCPLLHKSNSDWCHDRIFFHAPDWFIEIEKYLPIKNTTLTFSYLLISKEKPPHSSRGINQSQIARVTGDLLNEKGKSRQLVCRGPEREFLAWMHKNIAIQEIPRGTLIQWPSQYEAKSNEIRLQQVISLLD